MRTLRWTTGRVVILSVWSFALGVSAVRLIESLHRETIDLGEILGMLAAVAVLIVIVAGAVRDAPVRSGAPRHTRAERPLDDV